MTVRVGGADIVLHTLGSARHRVVHMTVENFMKLQNIVLRDWNSIETFMDNIQRITITCDFLFIAVPGRCFFLDKLLDSCIRGHNAFYGIGSFSTLYLGNFNEFFQLLRALFQI